jgi:transcriptional regulator
MYVPASFAVDDPATLHDFLRLHGFATLVTRGDSGLIASHLPLLFEADAGPNGTLIGHIARANPQWRDVQGEALAIFSGPHAYISPSWYEEEGTVPTWNYATVHAYGAFRIIDDRDGLLDVLRRTVRTYEEPRPVSWAFDETAPHVEKLLGAIVGFRIELSRLEGKWKLNQNHPEERRRRVIRALGDQPGDDARAIAALMEEGLE